jgi:hypothetical protein
MSVENNRQARREMVFNTFRESSVWESECTTLKYRSKLCNVNMSLT